MQRRGEGRRQHHTISVQVCEVSRGEEWEGEEREGEREGERERMQPISSVCHTSQKSQYKLTLY